MFEPFTPAEFQKQTGMVASENEAIYIRWVNTQINYANYQNMRQMSDSLKEILERLKDPSLRGEDGKYPFSR
jgi:hypothetical protein